MLGVAIGRVQIQGVQATHASLEVGVGLELLCVVAAVARVQVALRDSVGCFACAMAGASTACHPLEDELRSSGAMVGVDGGDSPAARRRTHNADQEWRCSRALSSSESEQSRRVLES